MQLTTTLGDVNYTFQSLKEVFAKANEIKSGDQLAGIAADTVQERIAAKVVLSELTLSDIRNNPMIPLEEDEVSRIIDGDIIEEVYDEVKHWTVAMLREYILKQEVQSEALLKLGTGLNSEMIAAVTKLMSNLDLIYAASKIEVLTTCNTTIGQKGTLASRLQPNHPTDNVEGILASLKEGLSYGVGDAVIGINPVDDSVESVARVLKATHAFIEKWQVPTQNCVLAHVTTQMEAIRQGAPADLMFQSIAGTEKANRSFGISAALLEEADALMKEKSTSKGPHKFYFETGQGSELSAGAHYDMDQVTLEARNYGFARHFNPFLVNTVVGFIGPEYLYDNTQVTRAGLEDHFMGKMHGLPMGVDVCYTNHMHTDQNDNENLGALLTAAGVNFVIAAPLGDDVMLNYQSLSYHDIPTLQTIYQKTATPAFKQWLEEMRIQEDGLFTVRGGDLTIFDEAGDEHEKRIS